MAELEDLKVCRLRLRRANFVRVRVIRLRVGVTTVPVTAVRRDVTRTQSAMDAKSCDSLLLVLVVVLVTRLVASLSLRPRHQ